MAPDAERGWRAGDVVAGRYELVRAIGRGGMGEVFEARRRETGARCALKRTHAGAGPDDVARMLREARALARLEHPHVVRLLDVDVDERGAPFLVQELLEGATLRAVLDEELTLPPRRALELLLPVLRALAYAHERGVVHRDLKPENIVLRADAQGRVTPTLVDFGLAREPAVESALTRRGATLGTPAYMSPEQAWGRDDVDGRSDVWSFGVVLYECLAGAPPYQGPNDRAVLAAIVADDPPHLRAAGVGVDDALADAVMLALVRAPEARCPSAAALDRALSSLAPFASEPWYRALSAQPVAPEPPRRSRSRRAALAAGAALAAAAAIGRAMYAPAPAPRAQAAPAVTAAPAAIAPDAGVVAPVAPVALAASRREVSPAAPRVELRRRAHARDASVTRGVNAAPIVDEL